MEPSKRAMAAVAGGCVAIFWPGAFIFGFPGVMGPYWQDMFHVGRGAIGNILFFVLAAVGICMFFVGRWQERIGIRTMVSIGAVMTGLDVLMLTLVSNLFAVYVWAFLMGAASCFIYIPALTTVQRWYPLRRGLATGTVNLVFALSAAVMAPLFSLMLETLGYRATAVVMGILALAAGIIGAQFTAPPREAMPEPGWPPGAAVKPAASWGEDLTVGRSLRTAGFWCLWSAWALQGAAGIAMVTLSMSYGMAKGFPRETAVVILAGFNLANGFSRLLMGHLSDMVGRNRAMSLCFLAGGLAYFALPFGESILILAALAGVVGFAFGTLFAVSAPLAVDCFGLKHFGAIFGLVFTAYGFVAGPLGPSLSGYILDGTEGNFLMVFAYLGTFCVVSAILIRFVKAPSPLSS
jgi:OFA family oxalate/formate antiporter-like MFS transporter